MSVKAVGWALEQTLIPAEKIVLVVLADCENGSTFRCDPGQKHIAHLASLSERTVRDILKALEQKNLIRRQRTSDPSARGGRKPDSYLLGLRFEAADSAGTPTGRFEGGNRQAVAGTEVQPEGTGRTIGSPVSDVISRAVDNSNSTGPRITPKTVSATHGKDLQHADVFASVGQWLPSSFTDRMLDELAADILSRSASRVLDPTAYVIRALRNPNDRIVWSARALDIDIRHGRTDTAAGF